MREPQLDEDEGPTEPKTNWTTLALIGGLALLVLIVAYFATRGNPDQDKLTNRTVATSNSAAPSREKLCANSTTYDLIKRELFQRAAQLRGSDQAAFDRLAGVAVVRMERPVMEGEDSSTGAVNCSGSLALDLPPGVEVVGGRSTLASDIDYTVTMAADGSGPVVLLKNADAIITPLATIAQVNRSSAQQPEQPTKGTEAAPQAPVTPMPPQQTAPAPQELPSPAQPVRSTHPSFDCSAARTRGEFAVCGDSGLAALDRQMAAQYARSFANASPEQQDILRETARRFYAYRDRCSTNACIADAYTGRMREMRDIMEGRWEPTR